MRHIPRLRSALPALAILAVLAACSPQKAPSGPRPGETIAASPSAVVTATASTDTADPSATPTVVRQYRVLVLNLAKQVTSTSCRANPSSCYLYVSMYPPSPCGNAILSGQTVTCTYAIPANDTVTIELKGDAEKVVIRENAATVYVMERFSTKLYSFPMTADRTLDLEMS